MTGIVERIIGLFINKKKIIGYVSAVVLAIGAAGAAMSTKEFKEAVCAAPVLEIEK